MRVLHVSDDPLPDARVEKMAYLSEKMGWQTFFAGPGFGGFALGEAFFEALHYIPWNRYVRLGIPPFWQRTKRKLKSIVQKLNPDLIHAHDVFAAALTCDLGYPFVFDDHELVSLEKASDIEHGGRGLVDCFAGRYEAQKWEKWERQICERGPVITVSEGIAEHYIGLGARTFVVPNYPSLYELSRARLSEEKDEPLTSVYVGGEAFSNPRPLRNTVGMADIFEELKMRLVVIGDRDLPSRDFIVSKGYVPHLDLYKVISRYHVGLLPWKKHWFHKYANPNKPYLYAHSGLVVVVTSSLSNVIKAFKGKCRTIEDSSDLKRLLLDLSDNMDLVLREGEETREFAARNFVFEKYEDQVMGAYRSA